MLRIEKVCKVYANGVRAVKDLDLTVSPGEVYVLLGANGAGKTTTLMMCLGFLNPTSGRILINDIDVRKDPIAAKLHVAYVSENVQLEPNFTAIQNLEFFARVGGRPDVTRKEISDALLRVGLPGDTHNRRCGGFSKGMRQRLGIAIAVIRGTDLVLLDEPTSGLDPRGGQEFISLLKVLRGEGKAILMTTHDVFRAKELADHLGIMVSGELAVSRTRGELLNEDIENLYLEHVETSVGGKAA
jgi:ABC-2 type transport system ATP-binding protein